MSIYKPSLLDKFKDFVNGIKGNWDQYEDHVAEFGSHQAESSSKHITESGSNENGKYIRFDDGTQICYALVNLPYSSPNALRRRWNYPANFIEEPLVNLNIGTTANITPHIREIGTQQVAPATTTYADLYQVRIENMTTFSQNDELPGYVVAIGRWK